LLLPDEAAGAQMAKTGRPAGNAIMSSTTTADMSERIIRRRSKVGLCIIEMIPFRVRANSRRKMCPLCQQL